MSRSKSHQLESSSNSSRRQQRRRAEEEDTCFMATPSSIDPFYASIVAILWSAAASLTVASVAGFKLPEGETTREYCHFETFRADCPAGEVVLMQKAFYGRKSLGRCVRTNFGFIGCYSNVLEYMDRLCSGRRSCDVEVIEPNFEDIRPCNVELKSYLEAEYVCLPVADAVLDSCEVTIVQRRPTVLPRVGAFACGTEASPWVMKVPAGQRINITLYEFSAAASSASAPSSASSSASSAAGAGAQRPPPMSSPAGAGELWVERQSTRPCRSYGRLWEQAAASPLSAGAVTVPLDICAGPMTIRESHVHTTLTSSVDVVLTGQSRHGYLLVFSVVGCPDVQTPLDMMTQYSADRSTAKVTCRDSDQSWRLVCSERGWHGYVGNCSTKLAKTQATSVEPFSHLKTSTVVAAIVVGVSLTISFFILTIGLFVLKKIRGSSSASGYSDHIVMTCPMTASAAAASSSASGDRSSPHLSSSSDCFDFRYHHPPPHHHPHPHHHRHPRSRYGHPLIASTTSASSPFTDCVPYPSASSSPPTSDDCPLALLTVSHGPRRKSAERDLAASLCRRLSFSSTAGVEASGLPSKSAQYGDCSCSDVETELLVRADRNCPDCVPCTGKGSKSSSGFPI